MITVCLLLNPNVLVVVCMYMWASKMLQENPPFLTRDCQLTPVDLYKGCKTVVYVYYFILLWQLIYYIIRLHLSNSLVRCIATDGLSWSVCLSVGHVHEPCKNSGTNRDADWRLDPGGPTVEIEIPRGRGSFVGLLLVRPVEKHWQSAALHAAKGIIQSSITARHAMRPFVRIL